MKEWGSHMNKVYWITLSGFEDKKDHLKFLYDNNIDYADDVFMADEKNTECQGMLFDAAIFARLYKIRVVVYLAQTKGSYQTQLFDGREYDDKKNYGLFFRLQKEFIRKECLQDRPYFSWLLI
jgi:hypothetical protein